MSGDLAAAAGTSSTGDHEGHMDDGEYESEDDTDEAEVEQEEEDSMYEKCPPLSRSLPEFVIWKQSLLAEIGQRKIQMQLAQREALSRRRDLTPPRMVVGFGRAHNSPQLTSSHASHARYLHGSDIHHIHH
jgi:hypothetical protein